jgi:hypothetical protein
MSGMLGQFLTESNDSTATSQLPSAYLEAVNTARFVKGFGITALFFSILLFLGFNLLSAGVGLGIGLFILRYDSQTFYRVVGIVVIVVAIILPINSLSPAILSAAVLWRGLQTLRVLSKLGREDEDWAISKKRALIGTIASGFGLGISLLFMLLVVIWMAFVASQSM